MKRILLSAAVSVFTAFACIAQDGVFKFNDDKHDFGVVEEGIQAAHEFEFTNTGTTPLIITDVRPSCGCTTPEWTKDPILPGKKGVIKASYNSVGRPGVFNKSITITSNSVEPTKVLYIKGIVDKKPEGEVAAPTVDELKRTAKLNLDKSSHSFGRIERGQKVTVKLKVKNSGKEPLIISSVKAACGCVSHKLNGESIPAGKSGELEVTYSPYYDGANVDKVTIYSNDLNNPKTTITLSADVVDELTTTSPLKEEKNNIPFK